MENPHGLGVVHGDGHLCNKFLTAGKGVGHPQGLVGASLVCGEGIHLGEIIDNFIGICGVGYSWSNGGYIGIHHIKGLQM